jgi:hypothetical protein
LQFAYLCVRVQQAQTTIARQSLGKHFPTATNIHEIIEELLDAVFPMQSVAIFREIVQLLSCAHKKNPHPKLTFSFCIIYLHQKDERAMPGNLHNSKESFLFPPNIESFTTSPTFFLLSLSIWKAGNYILLFYRLFFAEGKRGLVLHFHVQCFKCS